MQVAFVSSCQTFYQTITDVLKVHYPSLHFTYFEDFEEFAKMPTQIFDHLMVKIYNDISEISGLKRIQHKNPDMVVILMAHGTDLKISKPVTGHIDFIFKDKEILTKLDHYFHAFFYRYAKLPTRNPIIDFDAQTYIQLKPHYSFLLYQISKGLTAREIGEIIHKSPRTVEKQIEVLKKNFKVGSKEELKNLYLRLTQAPKRPA